MRKALVVWLALALARGAGAVDITLCVVPDIQNIVSNEDPDIPDDDTSCEVESPSCEPAYCPASPYCDTNWWHTSELMLANLAYSLTGQTSLIDYSTIKGTDNVLSGASYPTDHAPCDAIIGVGDNVDQLTGSGNPTYAGLTYAQQNWVQRAAAFWNIIKASGVPFLPARGNHDPEQVYDYMMTTLIGYDALPFVYAVHPDRDQYAIKFEVAGVTLCAVSLDYNGTFSPGDERTASEAAWGGATLGEASQIGCGDNLPTLEVSHQLVSGSSSVLIGEGNGLARDPAHTELFAVAGGHHTPATPISRKWNLAGTSYSNDPSRQVIAFFSNWQEMARHKYLAGYTITPHDGIGGPYTVIEIDFSDQQLCAHDWNAYYQTRSTLDNGQNHGGGETMSSACFALDWPARFRPGPGPRAAGAVVAGGSL